MSEIAKQLREFPRPDQSPDWMKPVTYLMHDAAAEIDKWRAAYFTQLDAGLKEQITEPTGTQIARLTAEVERLRAALVTLRDDILEVAAERLDRQWPGPAGNIVRELKSPPPATQEKSDDRADAVKALEEYDRKGGTSLDDLKKEIGQ